MKAAGTAVFLVAIFGAASSSPAQSLGEAARKERERRATQGKAPARTFDDADLLAQRGDVPPPSPSPSPSPAAAAPPSPESSEASPAEDEAAVRKRQEAEWQLRFARARERVSNAEANAWHEVVETVFVSGIPVQQRVRKFEETEELRRARQALADLEEEFRRTGLPPGWTRN